MITATRLFFAIKPNDSTQQLLTQLIEQLKQEPWSKYIRWTHPANLHITLRFIGNCQAEQIPNLITNIKKAIKTIDPFTLHLNNINLFPTKIKPYVLAININPSPALFQLAQIIEQNVVATGFTPENRAYLPHLTIGRLMRSNINYFQNNFPSFNINFTVDKIVLLNSEVVDKKHLYKTLEIFNF